MSTPLPEKVKVSPVAVDFKTEADFRLVLGLMERAPYRIPEHLRAQVIESARQAMEVGDIPVKLMAARLVLEMDKLNLGVVKISLPQKVEHHNIQDMKTSELLDYVREAAPEIQKLLPEGEILFPVGRHDDT